MEKKEVKARLREKIEETIGCLEEQYGDGQLSSDGLLSMLHTRYENARSVLRDPQAGYSRLRGALQFLTSANRAYIGSTSDWEDPLRRQVAEVDRWIDLYLMDETGSDGFSQQD